jgi:hypothetical protein
VEPVRQTILVALLALLETTLFLAGLLPQAEEEEEQAIPIRPAQMEVPVADQPGLMER